MLKGLRSLWESYGDTGNLKFRDLFTVEKMTILGEPTESLKETISVMNPTIKKYTGGINQ